MSAGIVKYFEMDGYGPKLNRALFALSGNDLPTPIEGADWRPDPTFDRGTEILNAPGLKEVFERVLRNGFEIVTNAGEFGSKAKGKKAQRRDLSRYQRPTSAAFWRGAPR